MSDICTCGHAEDEHDDDFIRKCQVPDDMTADGLCPCLDFESDNGQ